jgi:hypothetical protein
VRITFSVDDEIVKRAREVLGARGKTLNQEIREHVQQLANDDLKRDMEYLVRTSGLGDSNGRKFNRDELYERR